jgi:hypothetical protein
MKLTTQDFINKSKQIHGNTYDYSKSIYINTNTKLTIICKKHGEFTQLPSNHYKYNCNKCGNANNIRNAELKKKCKDEFIVKANLVHNNRYDYSKSIYENAVTKLIIICKIHGEFEHTPNNHLRNRHCPQCGTLSRPLSKRSNFNDYQKEFIKKHGDKYDYSKINWKGSSNKIILNCKKHGEFEILPYLHKNGKECQKCTNRYSKKSIGWLKYMEYKTNEKIDHAENEGEFNIINTRYKADGYSKQSNIVYEFLGDFWHGNPNLYNKDDINPRNKQAFGELLKDTIDKKNIIKKLGYNYVEIWESDWDLFIKNVIKIQRIYKKYKLKTKSTFIINDRCS